MKGIKSRIDVISIAAIAVNAVTASAFLASGLASSAFNGVTPRLNDGRPASAYPGAGHIGGLLGWGCGGSSVSGLSGGSDPSCHYALGTARVVASATECPKMLYPSVNHADPAKVPEVTIQVKLVQLFERGHALFERGHALFELYGTSTLASGSPNAGDTAVIRVDDGICIITATTGPSGNYSVFVALFLEQHSATVEMQNTGATSETAFS